MNRDDLARYRAELVPYARSLGATLPEVEDLGEDDDHFDDKIRLVCDERIPLEQLAASFLYSFGDWDVH